MNSGISDGEIALMRALSPSYWYESLPESHVLSPWQRSVLDSPAKRQIWNIHRQGGKSLLCAIRAAHRILYYPRSLVLACSPSERQSQECILRVVDLLEKAGVKDYLEKSRLSLITWGKSRLIALPAASDTIRGFSAPDLILEDESSFCADSLYQALAPMQAGHREGAMILCSTPNFAIGHYYRIWSEGGVEWERTRVIATEDPRISSEHLEREAAILGPLFSSEYLGEFIMAGQYGCFSLEDVLKALVDLPPVDLGGMHL